VDDQVWLENLPEKTVISFPPPDKGWYFLIFALKKMNYPTRFVSCWYKIKFTQKIKIPPWYFGANI
jgi:hypothetical protein